MDALHMPRPQIQRSEWLCLDGEWEYREDPEAIGLNEKWYDGLDTKDRIQVPFPPGAELSGQPFSSSKVVWFEKTFTAPDWDTDEILLTLGAADYRADVWVNGHLVGSHTGGYTPVTCVIKHAMRNGENRMVIRCEDPLTWEIPRGKQAADTKWPIDYDAVIGLWQSVWIEPVADVHVISMQYRFEYALNSLSVLVRLSSNAHGLVRVSLGDAASEVSAEIAGRSEVKLRFELDDPRLWSPEDPHLYAVACWVEPEGGQPDKVTSYCGLREVEFRRDGFYLNGRRRFLRGILDQGYFPKGWYTPPSEEELIRDIELTLELGFNLSRKHQKVEDPRFYYWADRLGLLVWAEMPSGRVFSSQLREDLTQQWMKLVEGLQHHPSVVAWVPFNESWGVWHQTSRPEQQEWVRALYHLTKSSDPTRPVIANDGWEFVVGDAFTLHLYQQTGEALEQALDRLIDDPVSPIADSPGARVGAIDTASLTDLPILITECGGVGFDPSADVTEEAFAYGEWPEDEASFKQRVADLTSTLNNNEKIAGFVWTQLTDVAQETNGLLYFDRSPKIDVAWLSKHIQGLP